MRENVRNVRSGRAGRERWEFALDNRQIAAVAVGALVIVGSAFVLGMNAGSMSARKAATPATANSLDAFDTAHANLPAPPEPKSWEYEKLGGGRAADAAPNATAQARVPPSPRPLTPRAAEPATAAAAPDATAAAPSTQVASALPAPAPVSTATPTAAAGAKPPPAEAVKAPVAPPPSPAVANAPAPSAMERAIAAVSGSPRPAALDSAAAATTPAAKSSAAYVIQVGASTNRSEADRIATRFAARGARVVTADVEGKRWYRVRLASRTYRDRPEAERALSRLSRETGVRGFVTAAQ